MNKIIIALIAFCLMAAPGFSQDEVARQGGQVSERINAKKMAFFIDKLQLTTEEVQNFWPLFTEYEKEQKAVREKYKSSKAFKFMSDKEAEQHVLNGFKAEEEIIAIKRDYFQKFKGVIPIRKIAMLNRVNRQFKEALLKQMRNRRRGGK